MTLPPQLRSPTPLSTSLLLLLSAFVCLIAVTAGYCMIYIQVLNNTIPTLQLLVSSSPPKLPGSFPDQPLVTCFTSIKPLDETLVNLVSFYWWAADGGYPGVSLFGFWMVGQLLLPLSVLLLLEGWRAGNKGKVIALYVLFRSVYIEELHRTSAFLPFALRRALPGITF
jgi:hypothetical protein